LSKIIFSNLFLFSLELKKVSSKGKCSGLNVGGELGLFTLSCPMYSKTLLDCLA